MTGAEVVAELLLKHAGDPILEGIEEEAQQIFESRWETDLWHLTETTS